MYIYLLYESLSKSATHAPSEDKKKNIDCFLIVTRYMVKSVTC